MRAAPLVLSLALAAASPAAFSRVDVNIGINLGGYPTLQPIPGYPVYYAPSVNSNYFFYDGLYWVFEGDNWYESNWYNGPWTAVDPFDVPVYLLRVPVRYYRHAPVYFRGWRASEAPRWGDHWGRDWEDRRGGWNRWDRRDNPRAAPLPTYQREYRGNRYPDAQRQAELHQRSGYNYQPRDQISQQRWEQHRQGQAQVQQQQQPQPRFEQRQERNDRQDRTPSTDKGMERRGGTGQDQRG